MKRLERKSSKNAICKNSKKYESEEKAIYA